MDEFGRTPLHVACLDGVGVDVVRLLLDIRPDLARQTSEDGWIPLHFAKNEETARLLLYANPQGVGVRDMAGRLPLHFAVCGNVPPGVVRLLVREGVRQEVGGSGGGGGVLVKSKKGKAPLDVICSRIVRVSRVNFNFSGRAWEREKLHLMVRAASMSVLYRYNQDTFSQSNSNSCDKRFRIVHSIVELGCPHEVIRYALAIHPEQARQRDNKGRTLLSIACSTPGTSPEVIDMLLQEFPRAVRMSDGSGRLPLHFAAQNGLTYRACLRSILRVEPTALGTRDCATRMYPFMLAAIGKRSDVDTVYSLLREKPDVLMGFGSFSRGSRRSTKRRIFQLCYDDDQVA